MNDFEKEAQKILDDFNASTPKDCNDNIPNEPSKSDSPGNLRIASLKEFDTETLGFLYKENGFSVTIPDGTTSIEKGAFQDLKAPFCRNTLLKSVIIPNTVTHIGDSAFCGCDNLDNVIIPSSVKSIGDCAFMYCERLNSFEIPESVISIGHGAFSHCSKISSITIPSSVTSIGMGVFDGWTKAQKIYVSKIQVKQWNKIKLYGETWKTRCKAKIIYQ